MARVMLIMGYSPKWPLFHQLWHGCERLVTVKTSVLTMPCGGSRRGLTGILIKLALVVFYGHHTGRRDGELAQSSYEAIVKLVKGAVHVAPLTGDGSSGRQPALEISVPGLRPNSEQRMGEPSKIAGLSQWRASCLGPRSKSL